MRRLRGPRGSTVFRMMASRDPVRAGPRHAVRLAREGESLQGRVLPGIFDAISPRAIHGNQGGFIRTVKRLGRRHAGTISYDTS